MAPVVVADRATGLVVPDSEDLAPFTLEDFAHCAGLRSRSLSSTECLVLPFGALVFTRRVGGPLKFGKTLPRFLQGVVSNLRVGRRATDVVGKLLGHPSLALLHQAINEGP